MMQGASVRGNGRRVSTVVAATVWLLAVSSDSLAVASQQDPQTAAGAAAPQKPAAASAPTTESSDEATTPDGVPVYYRGQEVFRVFRPLGMYSPQERARLAEDRLDALVKDPTVLPEQIRVQHGEASSELWAGERLISLITDQEAEAAGVERRAYAEMVKRRMARLIVETRHEFSAEEVTRGVVFVALATVLLVLLAWGLVRLTRRLLAVIDAWLERAHGIAIQRLELVSRATLARAFRLALRIVRALILIAVAVGWLEFVLSALPWTRPYARLVLPWLKAPFAYVGSSVIAALPNLFYIAVIVGLNLALLRLVYRFFSAVRDGAVRIQGFLPEWADPTYRLVRILIIAVTFVAAFPYIPGSSSPAFQGVSLFIGLLVSLSSSSAISNIIAGTILTYTGAFRMGDRVAIAGTTGDVVKRSLLTTHLRTIKNEVVAIPNSIVLGGSIVNYAALASEGGLILHTTVTIGYDAPWRTVHQLLVSAALATDGIEASPAPFVWQTALNDFYVSYEINAYTRRPHDMPDIYAALHANIQDAFNEGGVEIMSPHYSSLRDGNTVTIPAGHRPPGYEPGRFGVHVSSETRR
jgi:small-conductance mechanosensitive channel